MFVYSHKGVDMLSRSSHFGLTDRLFYGWTINAKPLAVVTAVLSAVTLQRG